MADKVTVDTSFMQDLASKQDNAATDLNKAANTVNGISDRVSISHGSACEMANEALRTLESVRLTAGTGMQSVSNKLASNLRKAADVYSETDSNAASQLKRTIDL